MQLGYPALGSWRWRPSWWQRRGLRLRGSVRALSGRSAVGHQIVRIGGNRVNFVTPWNVEC